MYADSAEWSIPFKPLSVLPSTDLQLGLAAPSHPLSLSQLADLRFYLQYIPSDRQAFFNNILAGGLGFLDLRPAWINGPLPRNIPATVSREVMPPAAPQPPAKVVGYQLQHVKSENGQDSTLALFQIFANGRQVEISLKDALEDPYGNLENLQVQHPNLWREFEQQNQPRKSSSRKKQKIENDDFLYYSPFNNK